MTDKDEPLFESMVKYLANASPDEVKRLQDAAALHASKSARPMTELAGGGPIPSDHRDINPATGQQKGYVVLTAEERAKGFVRPVRDSYIHTTCGSVTKMGRSLAETYARDPSFYSGTFCARCRAHFPLDQFKWDGTDETVGS